jgi:hypothetical protein
MAWSIVAWSQTMSDSSADASRKVNSRPARFAHRPMIWSHSDRRSISSRSSDTRPIALRAFFVDSHPCLPADHRSADLGDGAECVPVGESELLHSGEGETAGVLATEFAQIGLVIDLLARDERLPPVPTGEGREALGLAGATLRRTACVSNEISASLRPPRANAATMSNMTPEYPHGSKKASVGEPADSARRSAPKRLAASQLVGEGHPAPSGSGHSALPAECFYAIRRKDRCSNHQISGLDVLARS